MKASARIQVTLDVDVTVASTGGETLAAIRQEVITAAYQRLDQMLKDEGSGDVRVVGEPKVTIVLVEDV